MSDDKLHKVKISVIRRNFYEDLAKEYGTEGIGPCFMHQPGQVFYSNGWQKPSGLCDNAWHCMKDYVLSISQHGGYIYGKGGWCNQKDMCVVGCNDGLRTVIFKLEATDMESDLLNEDPETINQHMDPNNTSTK
ncbi:TIGR04076 family protein [uncultured Pseudoramibacter sp.]|uniref:TIGR04076 family protein n=1 Tax=uncultured Pseudoramibacter sp. TaxID=1623493 RepID=UPI0025E2AC23|nr:TIGR04076 family protein [uncultured Pseudoramibacter sp.]